jgi:glyoxylase I family protein
MLHHTALTICDLGRSLRFWPDAMAICVLFEQEKAGGYLEEIVGEPGAHVRTAHLAFGPRIELFQYLTPAGGGHAQRPAEVGFTCMCIACDDLEDRLDQLVAAAGVPFSGPVTIVPA